MTERMKGHSEQYKPPVLGKLASSIKKRRTSETYIYHFSLSYVKIMTLIDKRRQAFRFQDAGYSITYKNNSSLKHIDHCSSEL